MTGLGGGEGRQQSDDGQAARVEEVFVLGEREKEREGWGWGVGPQMVVGGHGNGVVVGWQRGGEVREWDWWESESEGEGVGRWSEEREWGYKGEGIFAIKSFKFADSPTRCVDYGQKVLKGIPYKKV